MKQADAAYAEAVQEVTGVSKHTASKTSGPAVGLYRPSFRALRAAQKPEVPDPSRAFKTLVALRGR